MTVKHGSRLVCRDQARRKNHGHHAAQDLQVQSPHHCQHFHISEMMFDEAGTGKGTLLTIPQEADTTIPHFVIN